MEGTKAGGPGLYMIEPSGLYWVGSSGENITSTRADDLCHRDTTVQQLERVDKQPKPSLRSWT